MVLVIFTDCLIEVGLALVELAPKQYLILYLLFGTGDQEAWSLLLLLHGF